MRARAALALLAVLAAGPARADTGSTLLAIGYVIPTGLAGLATAVNVTYLAYDEPTARGWKLLGIAAGGAEIVIGGGLLVAEHDDTTGVVLGSLALGLGAAALSTGLFVRTDDVQIGVMHVAGGAGLRVGGRF